MVLISDNFSFGMSNLTLNYILTGYYIHTKEDIAVDYSYRYERFIDHNTLFS